MPDTNSSGPNDDEDQRQKERMQSAAPIWQQRAEADTKTAKTHLQARLFGVFLFLAGLGMVYWIRSDIVSGAKVSEKLVIFTPLVLLTALSFAIEPRIMLAGMKDADPRLKAFKITGYVISSIGVAIGLYVRYTFFT